jgi:tryptophan 2,3-dioxygenase
MTPLDFLDFRNYLLPASGFQSFQFRKIEVLLGLKIASRETYDQRNYRGPFNESEQRELADIEDGHSMLEIIELWLERTPFLELGDFNFNEKYQEAVNEMIRKEREIIVGSAFIDKEQEVIRMKMLDDSAEYIQSALDKAKHDALRKTGAVKLSHQATIAALLINLYRDEPILQMPYQLLSHLIEIDELITSWRYRHAQMVLRMLGRKRGTGGSAGYDYLKRTVESHNIFGDLKNITTLLIPRSDIPNLPDDLKEKLGFHFSTR